MISSFFCISVLLILFIPSLRFVEGSSLIPKYLLPGNFTEISNAYRNSDPKRNNSNFVAISFINGIAHSERDWLRVTNLIENIFGQEIFPFYNPSTGSFMSDLTNAGYELVIRSNDIQNAQNLANHLRKILANINPKGRILHIAHSAGAILTYLAAKHHLLPEEKDRIDVVTFGGGRSITRKYFRGRTINYYAINDPLVVVDRRAANLMNKYYKYNASFIEILEAKHNTSFVFLQGLAQNSIMDHSLEGPTYMGVLRHEAIEYYKRVADMITKDNADRNMIRLARKKAANVTGLHYFWRYRMDSIRNDIRYVRKVSAEVSGFHGFFSGKRKEQI